MFKVGVVVALDENRAKARVRFDDIDGVLSYWLPVIQAKTLKDKAYWLPDVDEHVVCILDENGEDGAIIGAIYSDADSVPVVSKDKYHKTFQDGTVIEYDRQTHKLFAEVKGDIDVKSTGRCDLDCQREIYIKSATHIIIQAPSLSMRGGSPANGVFEGTFRLRGDLVVEGGNIDVQGGDINASGKIIDGGGNTNHHGH